MGKIVTLKQFEKIRRTFLKDKKVVLATGSFDILHIEHIRYLKNAGKKGNVLVVGVDPDVSVRRVKGNGRPINKERERAEFLSYLNFIDYILILPDNLHLLKGREDFIKSLRPDIYAVSEQSPFIEEKKRVMEKYGGKLIVVQRHNPLISTSKILKDLMG